jgi:hypothetical protein
MKLLARCFVSAVGLAIGLKEFPEGIAFPVVRRGGQYQLSINSLGGKIQ